MCVRGIQNDRLYSLNYLGECVSASLVADFVADFCVRSE